MGGVDGRDGTPQVPPLRSLSLRFGRDDRVLLFMTMGPGLSGTGGVGSIPTALTPDLRPGLSSAALRGWGLMGGLNGGTG